MRITEKEYLGNKPGVEKQLGVSRLYSRDELSELFNVSKVWLDKLVKFGEIPEPQIRIGRFKLFTDSQVEEIKGVLSHRVIAV